ncbi:hypothetical protein [Acrocarpospora phusangensis]|nr:hypothetical protein [Acrocarpospora phusangensis]
MLRQGVTLVVLICIAGCSISSGPVVTAEIPQGFLLTEAQARATPHPEFANEEFWDIYDDVARPFELNPCDRKTPADEDRVAMRTITRLDSAPSSSLEQLVLYTTPKAAEDALATLKDDITDCEQPQRRKNNTLGWVGEPADIGDESLRVKGYHYTNGESDGRPVDQWVVARRGAALFLYSSNPFEELEQRLTDQARQMAGKVCAIPDVCR